MLRDHGPIEAPTFLNPPVGEVALAAYFRPLDAVAHLDLAELRELWRDDFPIVEEHGELPPVEPERQGLPSQGFSFYLGSDGHTWPRTWFLNETRDRLIQLQRDRLVVNWRRHDPVSTYPRYSQIRSTFELVFDQLSKFVARRTGEELAPACAEVTYINPVAPPAGDSLAGLISPWSGLTSDDFLPPAEEVRVLTRYPIVDAAGVWRGRLYIAAEPASPAAGPAALVVNLFARIAPATDVMAAMDLAHDWVVRGFASYTTAQAHKFWERE